MCQGWTAVQINVNLFHLHCLKSSVFSYLGKYIIIHININLIWPYIILLFIIVCDINIRQSNILLEGLVSNFKL